MRHILHPFNAREDVGARICLGYVLHPFDPGQDIGGGIRFRGVFGGYLAQAVQGSVRTRGGRRAGGQGFQQVGLGQDLFDQGLGPGLAVHIGHQVRQLAARLKQGLEGVDIRGNRLGAEIRHLGECEVNGQIAFARQGVGHGECRARRHRLHTFVEIVHVDLKELAVGDAGLGHLGLARKIGHDAHHKGQLHLLLGPVQFHIILDLNPGGAVAGNELL